MDSKHHTGGWWKHIGLPLKVVGILRVLIFPPSSILIHEMTITLAFSNSFSAL